MRKMLLFVLAVACSDESAMSPATTDEATTTGTSTSSTEAGIESWQGQWYAVSEQFHVNEPANWGNGGDSFGFELFELRPDGATIRLEWCAWGADVFEYHQHIAEDGRIELDPVGGVHEFLPHGPVKRLFVERGADCGSLFVRQLGDSDVVIDFLTPLGEPLRRGKLCLAQCAEGEGGQGLITDCGVPVPWACAEP